MMYSAYKLNKQGDCIQPCVCTLLGIYADKTRIQKDKCTTLFIAALCTRANTWRQPKGPLTDERVKKMRHRCAGDTTLMADSEEELKSP